jgi:hypothetical protein
MSQLPPSLVILDSAVGFGVRGDSEDDFIPLSPVEDREPPPTFRFDEEPAGANVFSPSIARSTAAPRRSKPARASVGGELVKIVLGGIAGLLIAQAILWWLPRDWRKDPLGLAPKLPDYLAFLAPEDLRGTPALRPGTLPMDDGREALPSFSPDGQGGESGFPFFPAPRSDDTNSSEPVVDEETDDVVLPPESLAPSGLSELGPATGRGATDVSGDVISPQTESGDVESAAAGPLGPSNIGVDASASAPDSVDDIIGVRDAPSYSADQLRSSVDAAIVAEARWGESVVQEPAAIRQIVRHAFQTLCELSEVATFVEQDGNLTSDPLATTHQLLQQISGDASRVDVIGDAAASWLVWKSRPTRGVLLAGTVKSISQQGLFYETQLELSGNRGTLVAVISKTDPARDRDSAYGPGDRVFILGAIMENPKLDILGFDGDQPEVVWSGRTLVLPR